MMEKYGIIYKITNSITGKSYIGQTVRTLEQRLSSHKTTRDGRYLSNSIQKHGFHNFTAEILYIAFDKEELNNSEIYFIALYNTLYPNGYNYRLGGNQNGKCSEELKLKIGKARKGIIPNRSYEVSDSTRIKISKTLGGQNIIAVNISTNEVRKYDSAHQTVIDGFNPSNVISICKNKRKQSQGWKFYYINDYYANQSGSLEIKEAKHAQRIGIEPATVNYLDHFIDDITREYLSGVTLTELSKKYKVKLTRMSYFLDKTGLRRLKNSHESSTNK